MSNTTDATKPCRNHPHHCPGCGQEIECGYVCCATCTPDTPAPSLGELERLVEEYFAPHCTGFSPCPACTTRDTILAAIARLEAERDEAVLRESDARRTCEIVSHHCFTEGWNAKANGYDCTDYHVISTKAVTEAIQRGKLYLIQQEAGAMRDRERLAAAEVRAFALEAALEEIQSRNWASDAMVREIARKALSGLRERVDPSPEGEPVPPPESGYCLPPLVRGSSDGIPTLKEAPAHGTGER